MFTLSKTTMFTLWIKMQLSRIDFGTLKNEYRKDGIEYEKKYQEEIREVWYQIGKYGLP